MPPESQPMTWEAEAAAWPEHHIVPVIRQRPGEGLRRVAGTGFFLGRDLFVTCWHCVAGADADETSAASVRDPSTGKFHALPLTNLERDENGADLALANVPTSPHPPLRLSDRRALQGDDVWAYGYPLVDSRQGEQREVIWSVAGRLLRGYVTQGHGVGPLARRSPAGVRARHALSSRTERCPLDDPGHPRRRRCGPGGPH